MIVFVYNICPTLILATILGEVLRFVMGVHICVHNRHLYISVVKSLLYVETFKTQYVLRLLECKRIRKGGCLKNMLFLITFKPWLAIRIFLQGCLAYSVHDEVATHKMYQPWNGKMSVFLIVEKPRSLGISPGPRKLQHKVSTTVPFRRVHFVSPTVQFTLQELFFFSSSLHEFLFQSPSLA